MTFETMLSLALPAAIALLAAGLTIYAVVLAARNAEVMDRLKAFTADLARPFSIICTSASAAFATAAMALRGGPADWGTGALFIGAVYAGLAGLYWGKVWENQKVQGHNAEVEKAKVAVTPPAPPLPGTATITAAPDVDVRVREADDGALPADQRVKL
jgi:hypothetical protein